ncbi:MAG: methyltransferase domain-containing protein [Syntrophomonadaceae bacterium]|jgi:ubiquinone/menaquinone biosynthesis C-methylase UbiE
MNEFAAKFKKAVRANFDKSDKQYEAFEANSGHFTRLTEYLWDYVKESQMVKPDGNNKSLTILDVGCGNGCSTKKLQEIFPGATVYGLDFSEPMLELARENCPEAKLVQGDGEKLDEYFAPQFFDLVFYNASIFIMPDQKTSLESAIRVLKPGGVVAASVLLGLSELDHTPVESLPAYAGIIKNQELPELFKELFSPSDAKMLRIPLAPETLRELYSITALSSGLFPKLPYEERLSALDRLIEEVKQKDLTLTQDWLLVFGKKTA